MHLRVMKTTQNVRLFFSTNGAKRFVLDLARSDEYALVCASEKYIETKIYYNNT